MPRRPVAQQITFLDTRDLAGTADFYERILGLRLARDQGRCRIYHVCGGAYLGFCEGGGGPEPTATSGGRASHPSGGRASHPSGGRASHPARTETGGVVLTLVTDRVDEWCAELRAAGVTLVKEPADNPPYRIYNAFARDPNGYLVEIQRFWDPLE